MSWRQGVTWGDGEDCWASERKWVGDGHGEAVKGSPLVLVK